MRPIDLYLLHFDPPLKHARHYLGIVLAGNLDRRLQLHRTGKGARLTAAVVAAGGRITLAQVWRNVPPDRERALKDAGHLARLCPICNGHGAQAGDLPAVTSGRA